MKSLRLNLILFGLLTAVALYLFLSSRSGSYSPSEQEFAVKDTGRIESVFIVSASGEIHLSRTGRNWTVNGNPARIEAIRGMFVLVSKLEVKAPVSGSLEKSVLGNLDTQSTRVQIELDDGGNKAYRVYYDHTSDATYMILEGSDVAFRMQIRGYRRVNLEELYNSDPRFWKDNLIFQSQSEEIQAVSLINNHDQEKSFHLSRNEIGMFEVAQGIIPGRWIPASLENVEQYLSYFTNVRFESYMDPVTDTLSISEGPDIVLSLENLNGERVNVELFPVSDFNRLYARLVRGDDWVVVKYIQIDPLLKEFEYFAGV